MFVSIRCVVVIKRTLRASVSPLETTVALGRREPFREEGVKQDVEQWGMG